MKKESIIRQSNFELMRIVAMFMIVMYHLIIHGKLLENSANGLFTFLIEGMEFLIIVHVNLFVLLSGYFQVSKKFKMSRVISNLIQTTFYTILIMVVLSAFKIINLSCIEIIREIFLVENKDQYWFIKIYLALYCFSPFLNIFINQLNKKDFKRVIVVTFILISIIPYLTGNKGLFVNDGFTLYNFILLYFIGAYLKLYPMNKCSIFKRLSKVKYQALILCSYFFFAIFNYGIFKVSYNLSSFHIVLNEIFGNFVSESLGYENPFVIFQAVSLFLFFETLNIKSKVINKTASLVFGVYLFSENWLLRPFLYIWLKINNGVIYSSRFIFYVILIMILIFVVGILLEAMRQIIFYFIHRLRISYYFKEKFRNFCCRPESG